MERMDFIESRLNRLEKLMYLLLVMTAPQVLEFLTVLA